MPAISKRGKYLTKTKTQGDIGGVSSVRLYEKQLGSQGATSYKVFTLVGAYVPGSNTLTVFVNGQKAEKVASAPANATQYVETSAKVITFGASLQTTDVIEFIIFGSYPVTNTEWNTNTYEYTMVSAGTQVVLPFNPNALISVYVDGVRQSSDAYSLAGSTITFTESLPVGTKVLCISPDTDDTPLTNADTLDGKHFTDIFASNAESLTGTETLKAPTAAGLRYVLEHVYTVIPGSNNTYDLGTAALRFRTVYTNDLELKNAFGDYTIVEGENDLFLYNNKTNKVFKFLLQEVDKETAPPKSGR